MLLYFSRLVTAVIFDCMSIRKRIDWDGKYVYGHVNIGVETSRDHVPEATQALAFHLVFLNNPWKLSLGYFHVNSCNSDQLCSLVGQCLKLLAEVNVTVVSVTCGGPSSNIRAAEKLGCDLRNFYHMKPFFSHPQHGPVHFILDPCHMLKLVRNHFKQKTDIVNEEEKIILWNYVKKLLLLQNSCGLKFANKLTHNHVYFRNQIMKVKLAAQILSSSVADSLQYCVENKISGFENAEATIEFIRIFDQLFDILHSRSVSITGPKQALYPRNISFTKNFLDDTKKYILGFRTTASIPLHLTN